MKSFILFSLFSSVLLEQAIFSPPISEQLARDKDTVEQLESIQFMPSSNAAQWKSRFAHSTANVTSECKNLHQYCGGTFKGITRHLDYLKDMGFNAIWISPVIENTAGGYHGYWAKDLYKINDKYGTVQDLKDLVAECHKRDIWVMLDVVANHMGETKNDFQQFSPFNDKTHYHNYCIIRNYNNQREVEYCRIGSDKNSLADLDTESNFVQQELSKWIKWIVTEYNFDAVRIDTVKHVRLDFWPQFTRAAGVFSIGEVLQGDPAYVGPYQRSMDSLLNFPLYFTIRDVFSYRQSMWNFEVRFEQNQQYFRDVSLLGNFIDNHDFKRFLTEQRDVSLLKNALTFCLMAQGIPIVYQGTEFLFNGGDDPANRESMWPHLHTREPPLKTFFKRLNLLRTVAGPSFYESSQRHVWTQDDIYVFLRGEVLVVVTNAGSSRTFNRQVKIPIKMRMVDILTPSAEELDYKNSDGGLWVVDLQIKAGQPRVFYPRDKLLDSWKDFFSVPSVSSE